MKQKRTKLTGQLPEYQFPKKYDFKNDGNLKEKQNKTKNIEKEKLDQPRLTFSYIFVK